MPLPAGSLRVRKAGSSGIAEMQVLKKPHSEGNLYSPTEMRLGRKPGQNTNIGTLTEVIIFVSISCPTNYFQWVTRS